MLPGVGLCLSGGGYRAMIFHVGALQRLNEAGLLRKLQRISSVSGGSITAGVLALAWTRLSFDERDVAVNFDELVVGPLRAFARRTVDVGAVLLGALIPGRTISDQLARSYRRLFGDKTLADLPSQPDFVFDATNLQSGDLWRFSSSVEGDWRVGVTDTPKTPLRCVVAASSAFPPLLSPARLSFAKGALRPGSDGEVNGDPYTTHVVLSDGGVYDNLGLEAIWERYRQVLISDAGGQMGNQPRVHAFWPLQLFRVLSVIDNQVRDLRKRQAVVAFSDGQRTGAYWGIRSHVRDFPIPDPVAAPSDAAVKALAGVATRLAKMPDETQERLINWGYVICDTALRSHVEPGLPAGTLPYAGAGFGGGG
ncbi:MAG: patatin-like phospholipase family protein [Solirubrobacteraceae bacterium]